MWRVDCFTREDTSSDLFNHKNTQSTHYRLMLQTGVSLSKDKKAKNEKLYFFLLNKTKER